MGAGMPRQPHKQRGNSNRAPQVGLTEGRAATFLRPPHANFGSPSALCNCGPPSEHCGGPAGIGRDTLEALLARGQAAQAAGPPQVRSMARGSPGAGRRPARPADGPPPRRRPAVSRPQAVLTAAEAGRIAQRLRAFDIEEVGVGAGLHLAVLTRL